MSYVSKKRKAVSLETHDGHSFERNAWEKHYSKIVVENHSSLRSSVDKWIAPNDTFCVGHVHPNPPYYEDVAAKLKRLQRKRAPKNLIWYKI